ncbi:helix-turn-helix transcriptional regulator [Endozoicomonas lisbonensis]|uniref:helix-turn-helix transcriptional regulator n=1 Tax=Endozoicomonas lisbonensis TaxID=3120522 RepID=UPI003396E171
MENLPTSPLTPKEIEVLELAAQGLTDSEISKALNTSQLNIRDRLSSAKDKFAAKNMLQLIAMAMSKGLIEYKQPL